MISIKKNKNKSKAYIKPGIYNAECVSIGMHPDYADDSAILVKYMISDGNGTIFDFSEVFYNNSYNQRSADFFDYLEENGIPLDNIYTFVGCTEEVTIKKLVRGNRPMLSIVAREFVARAAGETCDI